MTLAYKAAPIFCSLSPMACQITPYNPLPLIIPQYRYEAYTSIEYDTQQDKFVLLTKGKHVNDVLAVRFAAATIEDGMGLEPSRLERNSVGDNFIMSNKLKSLADIKRLLVIVAMDAELNAILKTDRYVTVLKNDTYGIEVYSTKIGDRDIYVTKSGVGLVNAALAVAHIHDKIGFDALLLTGVGGAVNPELNIGDVVVSRSVLQHDSIHSGESGITLMASGELFLSVSPDKRKPPLIEANEFLVSLVSDLISADTNPDHGIYKGTVLSGSEFVADPKRKERIAMLHPDSLLVDMEAAAIAQVATKLGIPFVVVKTVADRMYPDDSISSDYQNYLDLAATNAARLITNIMNALKLNTKR